MANRVPDVIICGLILLCLLAISGLVGLLRVLLGGYNEGHASLTQLINAQAKEHAWVWRLAVNCFGYSSIFLPGYLIYKYVRRTNYLERAAPTSWVYKAVSMCMVGRSTSDTALLDEPLPAKSTASATLAKRANRTRRAALLMWYFAGLMFAYLIWGVLQEKIITQEYQNSYTGVASKFKDSQFLVFSNRLLGFVVAATLLQFGLTNGSGSTASGARNRTPYYKYSFASFSNIMSAWFQYEALKIVSFPTQVLAKSCKVIPVMLMSTLVSKTKYETHEYLTALLMSLGMVFFLSASPATADKHGSNATTLTGVFLLGMYIFTDSFTSNWQNALFKAHGMTSLQMMCGVSLFSSVFTGASLVIQDGLMDSLVFATEHPKFICDLVLLSVSSTIGQLFIYHTIDDFGPVVFIIIMNVRQIFSIILSCFIYEHSVEPIGIFGILLTFFAIFLRIFLNEYMKRQRRSNEMSRPKQSA